MSKIAPNLLKKAESKILESKTYKSANYKSTKTSSNKSATQKYTKETFKDKCAVVGVYNVKDASILAYYSLFAMQHRGQEASGIASSDGKKISIYKKAGLVTNIFKPNILSNLAGCSAIGHNRYSTAGEESINECQPIYARYSLGAIAIAHNGNLTNATNIRDNLTLQGSIFQSHLDTEVLIHLIAKSTHKHLSERIIESICKIDGAFALVILSRSKMFAIRDPYGLRPLSLGVVKNADGTHGFIVASETSAFDLIGATFIRDIKPAEMLVFSKDASGAPTYKSHIYATPTPKPCVFEYIYFSRPDSVVFGRNVYEVRKNLGKQLAIEHKIQANMVIPVPDSGVAAALGYAKQSGIDFELGIIRNHYVGRTFIEPTQQARELKVKLKLNPIASLIKGKDIIVIDDSVVRGTTSKQIIKILRQAGARKVYLLISAPPTISPCFYGVDTPEIGQLICANHALEDVRKFIGADYLGFLSLNGLKRSIEESSILDSSARDSNVAESKKAESSTLEQGGEKPGREKQGEEKHGGEKKQQKNKEKCGEIYYCQACFDGKYIDSVHGTTS